MMQECIIVVGNLSDGFQFVGPFEDFDEAALYAEKNYSNLDTWVATLYPYTNLNHYAQGTVAECEAKMRELTNGERGCADPSEHRE